MLCLSLLDESILLLAVGLSCGVRLCSLLGEDGQWVSFLTAVLQVKVLVLTLLGHRSCMKKNLPNLWQRTVAGFLFLFVAVLVWVLLMPQVVAGEPRLEIAPFSFDLASSPELVCV